MYSVICFILFPMDMILSGRNYQPVSYNITPIETVIQIIIISIYIIASLIFCYFGFLMNSYAPKLLLKSAQIDKNIKRRMKAFFIIVPVCFIIRAIFIFVGLFVNVSSYWWFDICYYSILEILPMAVLLRILHYYSRTKEEQTIASNNYKTSSLPYKIHEVN
eukprot:TRINITY_DN8016_c0_g1_i1.p1 TRINITY_DN8016_c0_g1~~TRINITY_DN8016_c0_g1_i1.p1  ORF type:complete len:162 (+),score=3.44 TRINITY_DN8016_c0_g1_i1:62-547(+)